LNIKKTLKRWLYWLFPSLEYEEKRKHLEKFFQKKEPD
jgi:hypothetical protein